MSSHVASAKSGAIAIIGDACVFTAVAIVAGPLALVIGPSAAWLLHGRRMDRSAVMAGIIGMAIGFLVVGGFFFLLPIVWGAIRPVGSGEFTVPVALLAWTGVVFLAVLVALDVDAVRDLSSPARQNHTRLDIARLVATLILAGAAVVMSIVQLTHPATGIGDAGVFALGAGAVGAVAMSVANALNRPTRASL